MNKEIQEKWTTALRSGEYKQRKLSLYQNGMFCCLGVLCDLYRKETNNGDWERAIYGEDLENHALFDYVIGNEISTVTPSPTIRHWAEIESTVIDILMEMNDQKGASFLEIADYIDSL